MKKKFLIFIGVVISATCLYWVFKGIALRDVGHAVAKANPAWLALALIIYAIGFIFRAIRWKILMAPIKPTSAPALLSPMVIGFFANNVLPFRMGELVRAQVTGQKLGISRTTSLGTIVVERICDTLMFLCIFLIVALFFPFPEAIRRGAYGLGGVCIGVIVALVIATKHQHTAHSWVERVPISLSYRKKVQDLIFNFARGISGMTEGSYLAQALALSVIIWTIEGTNLYFITRAFPVHITYPQAFFVLFFIGLAVTLPQAPGYVGTVEAFGVLAFKLLGIPKELSIPVVLTIHGLGFCFIGLLGCCALWKEGLSIGKLLNRTDLST